jgi:hypothetical protein
MNATNSASATAGKSSVQTRFEGVSSALGRAEAISVPSHPAFDAARPAASSVNASIRAASVDVTNDRLTSRLMDPDLPGSRDHPTITFKGTRVARYSILQNNGAVAGQTVFHAHVHLIPKSSAEDGLRRMADPRRHVDHGVIFETIRARLG